MITAFCLACKRVSSFAGGPQPKCSYCGGTVKIVAAQDQPKKPYALSELDRRFLRRLRIASEI